MATIKKRNDIFTLINAFTVCESWTRSAPDGSSLATHPRAFPEHGDVHMGDKMKMNSVVHFEMPAEDRKRMAAFYAQAFGWQTQMLGPEMGDYVVVTTTETDEKGPKNPGAINGGFFKKTAATQCPSVVIAVDDIQEHMKKVAKAGGKILGGQKPGQPDDIPGVGLYVSFLDTEGNRASMLQPAPRMNVRPGSGSGKK